MVAGVRKSLDLRGLALAARNPSNCSSPHIYYRLQREAETSAQADGVNQSPPLQWLGHISAGGDVQLFHAHVQARRGVRYFHYTI